MIFFYVPDNRVRPVTMNHDSRKVKKLYKTPTIKKKHQAHTGMILPVANFKHHLNLACPGPVDNCSFLQVLFCP